MADEKYKYLFPFEHIPCGARILVYGAGIMGMEYFRQLHISGYCDMLGFIDREWERYPCSSPVVYSPQQASEIDFDYIVIAIKVSSRANVVMDNLSSLGIPMDKLVYIPPRVETDAFQYGNQAVKHSRLILAYEKTDLSIAIRIGNGLGSAIIKKKIFEEITRILPEVFVDIYSMMKSEDIEAIYGFEPQTNLAIHEAGDIYERNKYQYAIAMRISTSIIIDWVDYKKIDNNTPAGGSLIKKLEEYGKKDAGLDYRYPSHMHVMRNLYKGKNCYSSYDCDGILHISDMKVKMKLHPDWLERFKLLGLGKYITINYGNGQTMKQESIISKQWPYEHFCQFIDLFKQKRSDVSVVQIGAAGARPLRGADYQILGENLELVKYVLKYALFHVDIEGGLVHLASQLDTRCVALFGPTPIEFFGYPQNINIRAGTCHGCIGLYENEYLCARGLERAECMYRILPEMVASEVNILLE